MNQSRGTRILLVAIGLGLAFGCGPSEEARIRKAREAKRVAEEQRREEIGEHREAARRAVDLVTVPGGRFKKGDRSFGGIPEGEVEIPAFQIGRYEVTNEEYEHFVVATEAVPPFEWVRGRCPEDRLRHPVSVPYADASAYAEWVGCRLPTKLEWEKAARGVDGRKYPWGNSFDPALCNCKESGLGDTVPVDSYPGGQSPYGCYNMAGNVKEWTSDRSHDGTRRILKGGGFGDPERWVQAAFEHEARDEVEKNPSIGFRLARDVE